LKAVSIAAQENARNPIRAGLYRKPVFAKMNANGPRALVIFSFPDGSISKVVISEKPH
jgi:hypothetical protein